MLVMEVIDDRTIKVIHYYVSDAKGAENFALFFASASGNGFGPIARVQQQEWDVPDLSKLEVLSYPDSVEVSKNPIKTALEKEGETDYGIFTNNCESFANYCCIGQRCSPQAISLKHAIVGIGIGSAVGGTVGAVGSYLVLKYWKKDGKKLDQGTKLKCEVAAAIGGAFIGGVVGYIASKAYNDSQYADEQICEGST